MRQPTLSQIAKKTNLSVSCVSRILAGKKMETFTEQTIERVQSVARELNYRPNRLVKGMQTGLTGMIGVIIPPCNDFYGAVFEGIHDFLITQDRFPFAVWSRHDSTRKNKAEEIDLIHGLIDRRVEGIIIKPTVEGVSDEYFSEVFKQNIPLVTVDRALTKTNSCYVGSDDHKGIFLAMEHLIQKGHRRIGYFGPDSIVSTGLERLEAFRDFVRRHPQVQSCEHLVKTWLPEETDAMAISKKKLTAILCANDHFAKSIYQALKTLGKKIPEDVSVIGYGNLPFSSLLIPALTTVEQHPYEVGQIAAQRLISRIQAPISTSSRELIDTSLVIRNSVVAPR